MTGQVVDVVNINELENALDDKQAALTQLEEKLNQMKQCLRDAQAIADKHGLTFVASLDLPEGSNTYKEYGSVKVGGTYYGARTDSEQGHWHWENSSLNC